MEDNKRSRPESFVNYVFERLGQDNGFVAKMRRADNPDTEYQSWGILAAFGINLERDNERLPYALVGSAICRSNYKKDGEQGLGAALAAAFDNTDQTVDKPAEARLRRLLSCSSTKELCRILRQTLSLLNDKSKKPLCFAKLLRDLLYFESANQEKIKKRWAMDFYAPRSDKTDEKDMES